MESYGLGRPLTPEMIEYASNDVTALIPTVYHNQKRKLTESNSLIEFKKRVEDEINYHIDEAPSKRRRARVDGIVESIISDIEQTHKTDIKFEDLTDEDEINAIHNIRFDKVGISRFIMRLRTEDIKAQLKEISDQLSKEGNRFLPKGQSYGFLRAYQYHPDKDIQESAKRLQKALDTLFLADMANKYSTNTEIIVIKTYEKDALRSIRPRSKDDRNINPIHLSLYWKKQENEIDSEIEQLEIDGRNYNIPPGKYKWIKYNCSNNVPSRIQMKAKDTLRTWTKRSERGNIQLEINTVHS